MPFPPRPLRIAIVLHPFAVRPVGRSHARALASELLGLGHAVHGFGTPPGTLPRVGSDHPSEWPLPLDQVTMADFDPDVLLAYDARSPAALFAARAARRQERPLVLVEDGHGLRGGRLERILRGIGLRLWGSLVRRRTSHVVALDPVARAEVERDGYEPNRIHVVPPGVDLVRYRPGLASHLVGKHGLRGRILLHVGPLEPEAGLDVVIEAFARTVGKRSDWSLVLAGDGKALPHLRATASRLGVGAQVRWVGKPRREELPGLLGASTLFAAPTDVDIRVVRRAMACGLPVLGADLPRLHHLIQPDGAGLLAEAGNVLSWTECLQRAAQAPERRRRWGLRAREIAEERFAWSSIARQFETILVGACTQDSPALTRGALDLPDAT